MVVGSSGLAHHPSRPRAHFRRAAAQRPPRGPGTPWVPGRARRGSTGAVGGARRRRSCCAAAAAGAFRSLRSQRKRRCRPSWDGKEARAARPLSVREKAAGVGVAQTGGVDGCRDERRRRSAAALLVMCLRPTRHGGGRCCRMISEGDASAEERCTARRTRHKCHTVQSHTANSTATGPGSRRLCGPMRAALPTSLFVLCLRSFSTLKSQQSAVCQRQ